MSELGVIAPWIAAGAATVNTIFILVFGFLFNSRLEQVKSQLSLQIHVHRVKFEKEFQVLQEVWSRLVCLRNAGAAFTPGFKSGQSDESEDKKQFGQAYNALLRTIDNQKPFFPQAIFDLLENYRKRQFKYFIDQQFITRPDFKFDYVGPEFWKKMDENLNQIEKLAQEVCEVIRKRAGILESS